LDKFSTFERIWREYRGSLGRTYKTLEPLRGSAFNTIMLSYPRNQPAWQAAEDLIASSSLSFSKISELIDPYSAADELFSHVFFETFLELYGSPSGYGVADFIQAKSEQPRQVDWLPLYEYVDRIFSKHDLEELLTIVYMFRIGFLQKMPSILLSNPYMVDFLASLPVETNSSNQIDTKSIDFDVVGLEFFRQLLSPRIDPLNNESVHLIQTLRQTRPSEIDALARKCLSLAQDLGSEVDLSALRRRIAQYIRANVEKEIAELLSLDKMAAREFLDSVLTDAKAWSGIATLLFSLRDGGPLLTAGSAIASVASIGSKAMKAAADRRKKLESSDYTLLYRIAKTRQYPDPFELVS
jgi:hypothetical protein